MTVENVEDTYYDDGNAGDDEECSDGFFFTDEGVFVFV